MAIKRNPGLRTIIHLENCIAKKRKLQMNASRSIYVEPFHLNYILFLLRCRVCECVFMCSFAFASHHAYVCIIILKSFKFFSSLFSLHCVLPLHSRNNTHTVHHTHAKKAKLKLNLSIGNFFSSSLFLSWLTFGIIITKFMDNDTLRMHTVVIKCEKKNYRIKWRRTMFTMNIWLVLASCARMQLKISSFFFHHWDAYLIA